MCLRSETLSVLSGLGTYTVMHAKQSSRTCLNSFRYNKCHAFTFQKKIDERDELERERDFIKNQVERGKDEETFKKPDTIASSLKRKRTDEKIQLALKVNKTKPKTPSVSRDGVDDSVRKAFKMKKKRKSGGEEDPMEGWSIEDVKDKMFAVEALVAKDPTNLKNIEELKKQVGILLCCSPRNGGLGSSTKNTRRC